MNTHSEVDTDVLKMLSAEESQTLEFKASLLTPTDTVEETMKKHNLSRMDAERKLKSARRDIIYSSMKAIGGFANTDGGNLFIGVADRTREILGLEYDFQKVEGCDGDGFMVELKNQLRSHFGGTDIFSCITTLKILKIDGKSIAHVRISPSTVSAYPIFVKVNLKGQLTAHEKYYTRVGNSTEELTPRDFFGEHWIKHLEKYGRSREPHALGMKNEALERLDKIIRLDPGNIRAHIDKGHTLYALGMKNEALECFDKAIRLDPGNTHAHVGKGETLYALDMKNEARKCFDKAIKLDPDNVRAHIGKSHALCDLGMDVLEDLDRAVKLDPRQTHVYTSRGHALCNLRMTALECFDRAVKLDPGNARAHGGKGAALRALGKTKEAFECFDRGNQAGS